MTNFWSMSRLLTLTDCEEQLQCSAWGKVREPARIPNNANRIMNEKPLEFDQVREALLSRFVTPGRDADGFIVTILIGIAGSLVATSWYPERQSAGLISCQCWELSY